MLEALADSRAPHVALLRQLVVDDFYPAQARKDEPFFKRMHEDGDLADHPHPQHELLAESLDWPVALAPPVLAVLSRHGLVATVPGPTYGTSGTTFQRATAHGAALVMRLDAARPPGDGDPGRL